MPESRRYFALFGARRTGKTAYLASLYATSGDAGGSGPAYHASATDDPVDPTHPYLARLGRALEAARWPDSTPFERLTELTVRFTSGDLARTLVLPDVGGELTIRDEQGQLDLKGEILARYQDYHGFLIFIPADLTDPGRAAESKWEVDVLLDVLRERVSAGRTRIARPFAILVTKWDLIEPGPITGASEGRAENFLESVHPGLISALRALCENLRIFPVSATGPLVDGRPPTPLRPTNLGGPLAWLVEASERVMLERALAFAERHRHQPFRRDPDDPRRQTFRAVAMGRLEGFLDDVPHGPSSDRARCRLDELRRLGRRRLAKQAGIAAAVVISLAVAASGGRDFMAYRRARELLDGSSPDPARLDEVVARVDAAIGQPPFPHPVGDALGWWGDLRRRLGTYRRGLEDRSFEALERAHSSLDRDHRNGALDLIQALESHKRKFSETPHLAILDGFRSDAEKIVRDGEEEIRLTRIREEDRQHKAHPDDRGLASKLLEDCDGFLADHPRPDRASTVESIRAEVQAVASTMARAKNYEELRHQLARAAESPLRCHQLCTEFLKEDPSHPKAREVGAERDRFLGIADDRAWSELSQFARKYPNNFPEWIARCDDYLKNTLFTAHRADAVDFRKSAVRGHDRASYQDIRNKAAEGVHPATLLAVRKLCSDYVSIPNRSMAAEVDGWAKWFDDWGRGREFYVRVSSVRIERNSSWHHHFSIPDPWVHATVRVGAKTYSTADKYISLERDDRDLPGARLGPFTWKWGDPDVVISLHHEGASPPEYSAKFGDSDAFKVRHLDVRTSFDGGRIFVRLECPAVVPPGLPSYKD